MLTIPFFSSFQDLPDSSKVSLDQSDIDFHRQLVGNFNETQEELTETVETETIDNIQNEITSTMLLNPHRNDQFPKKPQIMHPVETLRMNQPVESLSGMENQLDMLTVQQSSEEGGLTIDERKRNSAKR